MYVDDTIPNVTKTPSYNIEGELYLIHPVDVETMKEVDFLEDGYTREEVDVRLGDNVVKSFMYFSNETDGDRNTSGSYSEYLSMLKKSKKEKRKKEEEKREKKEDKGESHEKVGTDGSRGNLAGTLRLQHEL